MLLADVIGTVITDVLASTIEENNPTFLIVAEVTATGEQTGETLVALDLMGASKGERVLISQGSSVRQTIDTKDKPLDAVIAGIVDIVYHDDKETYHAYK